MIRTIIFERDADTDARSVLDIRQFDRPATATPRTWTDIVKERDPARRALVLDIMRQIDGLVTGEVDEINILLMPANE